MFLEGCVAMDLLHHLVFAIAILFAKLIQLDQSRMPLKPQAETKKQMTNINHLFWNTGF